MQNSTSDTLHTYLTNAVPFGFHGAILYARQGQILLNEGYGYANRSRKILNTARTAFDTGSINKPFTAIAIMQLLEQGKIRLDDTLPQYFESAPPDKEQITIQHLLTHTAGICNYPGEDDFEPVARDEAMKRLLESPLVHAVDERTSYSNGGFALLGMIIEMVTGQHYKDYMRQHVFAPAGMETTGWYGEHIWSENDVAHGYVDNEDKGSPYDWDTPQWALLAQGGLTQPVSDLFKAHEALKHGKLLQEETQQLMYTPYKQYALGWHVVDTPYGRLIQHGGASSYGFTASFRRYVDADVVLVIACNSNDDNEQMAMALEGHLVNIIFGHAVTLPPALTPHKANRSYAGTYQAEDTALTITAAEDSLEMAIESPALIDWLFPSESSQYIHTVMRTIIQELSARNFNTFIAHAKSDVRVETYEQILDDFAAEGGELQSIEYLGTRQLRQYNIAHLRLRYNTASFVLRLAWLDKTIHGRLAFYDDVQNIYHFKALPQSPTHFVAYDLNSATRLDLTFSGQQVIITEGERKLILYKL